MSTTLQPVFNALGYETEAQQRAFVKLLHAAGAFGVLPEVNGIVSDVQAQAILDHVTFANPSQAAHWLHETTQATMLRSADKERCECQEPVAFVEQRPALLSALNDIGLISHVEPKRNYYDHVLVLGAMEEAVDHRLDTLRQLWDQGVRVGQIHLLGSERALMPEREPSASHVATEAQMMEKLYLEKREDWPEKMQAVRVFEINAHHKKDGSRANTQDTIKAWHHTNPEPGRVLVISNQPYVRYQDAAVKSVLPASFHVETVGVATEPEHIPVGMVMDSLARQIDIGMPKLLEKLKSEPNNLKAPLTMLDPAEILTDAATYQFRSGGDKNGVTAGGRIKTARWSPIMDGDPLLVYERLDSKKYILDGHHRLAHAMETNANGTGPGQVAAMIIKEADGITPLDAKIIAAYKNIAHGKCDLMDTARVFKQAFSGQVHQELLPSLQMDKGNLQMAFHLSKLSGTALDQVAKGNIPAAAAAHVAIQIGDQARQNTVMRIISEKLKNPALANASTRHAIPKNWGHIERGALELPNGTEFKYENITAKSEPGFLAKLEKQRATTSPKDVGV